MTATVVPSSGPYRPTWEPPAHYYPDGSVAYAPGSFFASSGSGLIWSDHSDGTWASVQNSGVDWGSGVTGSATPTVVADFPAAPGATSITSVTFRALGTSEDSVNNPNGIAYAAWRLYSKADGYALAESISQLLTTSAADYTPTLASGDLGVALSYLQAGSLCVEIWLPGGYATVTTFEVWLTIEGTGPVVEVPVEVFFVPEGPGVAPPLRQYPRADGLGASSARRVWPVPASEQRGIRRVGGYL